MIYTKVMSYKLIVLAPSCGGKSSLMRYLRENTHLEIAETDEEVMKANNDVWPDDDLKNKVLVPQTTREIITKGRVVYFASYVPTGLLKEAVEMGFMITVLQLSLDELLRRNTKRMNEEGYDDVSQWLKGQLSNFKQLADDGMVNHKINGNRPIENVAAEILELVKV